MSAVKRLLKRRGTTWQIQYCIEGAQNAYKRTSKTLTAAVDFTAVRTETAKEKTTIDVRGEERTLDVQLIVDESVSVTDIEDTTKLAPIVTSPSGVKYDAIVLGREGEVLKFRRIFLSKRRG